MNKKLYEIIRELEDRGAIDNYFLHRQYYTGNLELNIEFKNDIADKILEDSEIKEVDCCAFSE